MFLPQFLFTFFNQSSLFIHTWKLSFLFVTLIFTIRGSPFTTRLVTYSRVIVYTPQSNPSTTFNLILYIIQIEPIVNPMLSGLIEIANLFRNHTLPTLLGNGVPKFWRIVYYFPAKISEGVVLPLLFISRVVHFEERTWTRRRTGSVCRHSSRSGVIHWDTCTLGGRRWLSSKSVTRCPEVVKVGHS